MNNLTRQNISLCALLVFAFLLPLSRSALSFFVLFLPLLAFARRGGMEQLRSIAGEKIFLYLVLFLGFLTLSALWSHSGTDTIKQLRMYGYWVLIIPSFVALARKEWLHKIINSFLAGMVVSEIIAYGLAFGLFSFGDKNALNPNPFMSHIHYSVFLAFASITLLAKALSNRHSARYRISSALFFITSSANLMFSNGRTGLVAYAIAMVMIFIVRYRARLKMILLAPILLLFIATLSYSFINNFKTRTDVAVYDIKNINNGNYNGSFGIRAIYWRIMANSFSQEPLLGVGIGDYKLAAIRDIEKNDYALSEDTKSFITSNHYHNQYLMIITQAGLIGFALMLLLYFKLFTLRIDDTELKTISIIGLTVIAIGSIAEPLWLLQFPLMLWLLIVSVSISASRQV